MNRRVGRYETRVARAGKSVGSHVASVLAAVFGSRAGDRFGILYYHRVAPSDVSTRPPLNVPPARFASQIAGLTRRGYRFAPLTEVLDRVRRGERLGPRTAVLTFDDGYGSVYQHAWPVLRDLGVPATIFLATAYMGEAKPFPFDHWALQHEATAPPDTWVPLTWDECQEMAAAGGVEFGTHTHTHRDLRADAAAFEEDLRRSIEVLEARLGRRPTLFSFPFGSASFATPALAETARRVGLHCGLTTRVSLADPLADPFTWGRLEGTAADTARSLAAKLDGWYAWMEAPRRTFHRVFR